MARICSEAFMCRLSLASVIRLQMKTFKAGEAAMASGTPRTRRLVTRLVNSDPGPIVMTSAAAMAARACGKGSGFGGTICNSTMRCWLALMLVSPSTSEPSSIRALSCTFAEVAGRMCPRVARISDACWTATAKSPVMAVRAARNKLPKLCPSRSPGLEKRNCKSLERKFSSSESATRQLRTSPGGSMPNSRRRRPLDPPSSLTVTSAVRSEMKGPSGAISPVRTVYCLRPLSRVERPVPPPMATTRIPRAERPRFCSAGGMRVALALPLVSVGRWEIGRLWIEQFSKPGIISHVLKVRIVAGLEAVLGIQADGFTQILERAFNLPGKAINHGHAVIGEVCLGIALEDFFHVGASLIKLTAIQERNSVIKVLFMGLERGGSACKLLVAKIQMDPGAVHKFAVAGSENFLQQGFGFFEFMFLHGLDSSFVILHSLCKTRIFPVCRFLRRSRWFLPRHRRSSPNRFSFQRFSRRTFNTSCQFLLHSVVSLRLGSE